MAKPYVTVSLLLHGQDSPVDIADYVDNAGRFVALGTQAMAMLGRHETLHYIDAEGVETIIPYHAVVAYTVSKTSDDYTKLDDEYCVPDPCVAAGTCHASWTITFYNGKDKVGEVITSDGEVPKYNGSTPVKEGYTFIGWNTSDGAATALEGLPAAAEAASYYAIFEANPEPDPNAPSEP